MCKEYRRQFTSAHGSHTEQEEKLAILLYCMGLSMTAIGKILHYHTSTIMRWIRKYAQTNCRKPEPKGLTKADTIGVRLGLGAVSPDRIR